MIIGICFPNNINFIDHKTNLIKDELLDIIGEYDNTRFINNLHNNIMIFANDIKSYSVQKGERQFILSPFNNISHCEHDNTPDIIMYVLYMVFFGKFIVNPPEGDEVEVNNFIKLCKFQYKCIYKRVLKFVDLMHKKGKLIHYIKSYIICIKPESLNETNKSLEILLNCIKSLRNYCHNNISPLLVNSKYSGYNTLDIFIKEFEGDVGSLQHIKDDNYIPDIFTDNDKMKVYTLEEAKSQLLYVKSEISKILLNNGVDTILNKIGPVNNMAKRTYLIVNETTSDILTELLCSFIGCVDHYQAKDFAELKIKLEKSEISK